MCFKNNKKNAQGIINFYNAITDFCLSINKEDLEKHKGKKSDK